MGPFASLASWRHDADVGRLLVVVAMCLTAACGDGSVQLAPGVDGEVRQRLLAAADRAAKANDGEAKRVEAVKTTRGTADDLTGSSGDRRNQEVWVIQVSGTNYSCKGCSRPMGARVDTSKFRFITLVLTASDYAGTDFGIGPRPTDLSRYGEVEVLRE